jgi:hypothetical protein
MVVAGYMLAFGEVAFWPDGPKLGMLSGLCPDCTETMNKRSSLAKLKAAAGDLTVSMRCADSRLSRMPWDQRIVRAWCQGGISSRFETPP